MPAIESSIPGFGPFPAREKKFKTQYSYIEGRREIDGAEDLWRIRDNLYDLEGFAKNHPGGEEWIRLTKGTDITEIFEFSILTILQFYNYAFLQYHSTTIPQFCIPTILHSASLQFCNSLFSQFYNSTSLQLYNSINLQFYKSATLQLHNPANLQFYSRII